MSHLMTSPFSLSTDITNETFKNIGYGTCSQVTQTSEIFQLSFNTVTQLFTHVMGL